MSRDLCDSVMSLTLNSAWLGTICSGICWIQVDNRKSLAWNFFRWKLTSDRLLLRFSGKRLNLDPSYQKKSAMAGYGPVSQPFCRYQIDFPTERLSNSQVTWNMALCRATLMMSATPPGREKGPKKNSGSGEDSERFPRSLMDSFHVTKWISLVTKRIHRQEIDIGRPDAGYKYNLYTNYGWN